jgi:3',5'-cyclic AMP phosphodiesterase CpdA
MMQTTIQDIRWAALRSLGFCLCWICLCCIPVHTAAAEANDTLVFVSDTQAPLRAELLIRSAPLNQTATKMILADIAAKRPSNVFLLGDLVAAASRPRHWRLLDSFLMRLRAGSTNVWACLGNHEYLYNARSGLAAFQQRFPAHKKTGYFIMADSVAVVLLNSNFSKLTPQERQQQVDFYTHALDSLDKDEAVKVIIVACHHPPYSNSRVVGSNLPARELFAQPFLQTKKGMLFLSGHSHNFEHFKISEKHFLVIGGGGGISQLLNTRHDRIACENEDCQPIFHYLMVKRENEDVWVIVREVTGDLGGFNNVLRFKISASS